MALFNVSVGGYGCRFQNVNETDFAYPEILNRFGEHLKPGRMETRAFLGWFLEHYFRIDGILVEDSICDGSDDKGVDGIYVDSVSEVVYVFQSKLIQKASRTIGDSILREFSGALQQFSCAQAVRDLASSTGNNELKGLLISEDIAAKVESGYAVRGIFLSNIDLDSNGQEYLIRTGGMMVFDRAKLIEDWLPPGASEPISSTIQFHLDGLGNIEYKTDDASVFVVSLRASELIQMAGIESQALFAWNVRKSLGRTKVNRDIAESIGEPSEHRRFMLYHNGLTILASVVDLDEGNDLLVIDRYSVVNGAQSLSTLHEKGPLVTDELRLLTRIIKLDPASELAAQITRISNNQNSISARDLQSNSVIQKRLKEEFGSQFKGEYGFEIKRGEIAEGKRVITNEEAAKTLLAFDLGQPWSCHQSYRHFDELHALIFGRPVVTAKRIVGLLAVYDAVRQSLASLDDQLAARYSVTPYFMMHLVKQALEFDETGKDFCKDPGEFIVATDFDTVVSVVRKVSDDLVVDLNAEIAERQEQKNPFDHKRELKSSSAVRSLSQAVLSPYQKAVNRGRAPSFGEEWRSALEGKAKA